MLRAVKKYKVGKEMDTSSEWSVPFYSHQKVTFEQRLDEGRWGDLAKSGGDNFREKGQQEQRI